MPDCICMQLIGQTNALIHFSLVIRLNLNEARLYSKSAYENMVFKNKSKIIIVDLKNQFREKQPKFFISKNLHFEKSE